MTLITLAGGVSGQTTVENCQTNIYGCQECSQLLKNSDPQKVYHSCTRCEPGLYLYKHKVTEGIAAGENINICVPGCREMDSSTSADEAGKQCVFLGHRCQIHGYVQSSVTNKLIPTCEYSEFDANGFKRTQRRAAVIDVLAKTSVDPLYDKPKTLAELHAYALMFVPPTLSSTASELRDERNSQVLFECQQRMCQSCSGSRPMTCERCYGRFGEAKYSQACYRAFKCPGQDAKYETGCFKHRDDCIPGCHICDLGYSLQGNGICEPCSSISNCGDCEGAAGSLKCTICNDGYGLTADGKCQKCTVGSNVKRCKIDSRGSESIELCENGYILNKAGNECVTHCSLNEYEAFATDNYGINSIKCETCDSSCRTCVRSGTEFCTSCSWGSRLTKISGQDRGTCSAAPSHSGSVTQIFVKGLANDPTMDGVSTPGSFAGNNVVNDLPSAIQMAKDQATGFTDVPVIILMETGTHVINQDHIDAYKEAQRDGLKPSLILTIRPFKCSDKSEAAADPAQYRCQDFSGSSRRSKAQQTVKVISKVAQQLVFQVSQSMTMDDIHFDAIDSVQPQITDALRSSLQQVCTISRGAPTCADDTVPVQINSDPICLYRHEASLFQFANTERAITDKVHIQSLVINNCSFSNFFYEVGSMIRLPQRKDQTVGGTDTLPFRLEVTNSRFEGLSFCGSIISNDYPTFRNETGYMKQVTKVQEAATDRLFSQLSGQTVESFSMADKYKIVFEKNTVTGLFMGKRGNQNKLFAQKVPIQMQKIGLALHLVRYPGSLKISQNTFQDAKLILSDMCTYEQLNDARSGLQAVYQTTNTGWQRDTSQGSAPSPGTSPIGPIVTYDTYQLHSLLLLDQQSVAPAQQVSLDQNVFNNILLSSSVVSISTPNAAGATVQFTGNQFNQVQSHLSSAVSITMSQASRTVEADEVIITDNKFEKVYSSCQQSQASLLTVQRNQTDQTPSFVQAVRQLTPYDGSSAGKVTMSGNQVDEASLPEADGGRLFSIKHFSTVTMSSDTFNQVKGSPSLVDLTFLGQSASVMTDPPRSSRNTATIFAFAGASTVSLTSTTVSGVTTILGNFKVMDVGAATTTITNANFNTFQLASTSALLEGTSLSSLKLTNCQLKSVTAPAGAFVVVAVTSITTLEISGLTVDTISAYSFILLAPLTANSITISGCAFTSITCSAQISLMTGLTSPDGRATALSISGTAVTGMNAPTTLLFDTSSAKAAISVSSSQFKTLSGSRVELFANANAETTIDFSQTTISGVTMQNTDGLKIVSGGVKQITFTEGAVSTLTGGASLFVGSSSVTEIEVSKSTFDGFTTSRSGGDVSGFTGKSVTIKESTFTSIQNPQVTLVEQALSVKMISTKLTSIGEFRGINANGAADDVLLTDCEFSGIAVSAWLVTGGHNSLAVSGLKASGITVGSRASGLLLMRGRSNTITGSTFSAISGTQKFDLLTIYMVETGGSDAQTTMQDTTFTSVCVKQSGTAAADGCSARDDTTFNTILIRHPGLAPDRLQAHKLTVSGCTLGTSGPVVAYTQSVGSAAVTLPLDVTLTTVQAAVPFLGIQNAAVRSISAVGVTVSGVSPALASGTGDQYLFDLSGTAATEAFLFKDFAIDLRAPSWDYDARVALLKRGTSGRAPAATQSLTVFKVAGFTDRTKPVTLENIEVRGLNMSQGTVGSLNSVTFLEVDSVSSVTMKSVTIRDVESGSAGVFAKSSTGRAAVAASLAKSAQPILDLTDVTVENVISLRGTTGGLFALSLTKQHLTISGGRFQRIFGAESTVIYGTLSEAAVAISNTQASNNLAMAANSFGTFSAAARSTVSISSCTFVENEVVAGSSLLQVQNSVDLTISDSKLTDNKASKGTHGILVVPDAKASSAVLQEPRVALQSSSFTFSAHPDAQAADINGAFVQISQIEGKPFAPALVVSGSTFRMGAAQRGGAIFYGRLDGAPPAPSPVVQSLTLQVSSSTFAYNTALQDGAAICLDQLNYQDLAFESAVFEKNSAAVAGDNIFARQTLRVAYAPPRARRLTALPTTTAAAAERRRLVIKATRFESGQPRNQVHLEGLESVTVEGSTFKDTRFGGSLTDEGLAFEGAGIYMRNVYEARLTGNTFEALAAKVRGGALMIKQDNATFFGQAFLPTGSPPLYGLEGNSFTGCSAQQGGAVYLSSVRGLAFSGTNTFTSSTALRAATIPAYVNNNDQLDPIASTAQLGQGPALFTDCGIDVRCSVTVAAGTVFSKSLVVETASGTSEDATASSIFAVGEAPSVQVPGQTVGEYIAPTVAGSAFVLLTDPAEIAELRKQIKAVGAKLKWKTKAATSCPVANAAGSKFRELFGLDRFTPGSPLSSAGSHLFGDSTVLAVVDANGEVQVNDDRSKVTFECNQELLNPNYVADLPKKTRCLLESGASFVEHELTFEDGLVDTPRIFIDSLPNVTNYIKVKVRHLNTDAQTGRLTNVAINEELLSIDMLKCSGEQIVNAAGLCESCPGPSLYKRIPGPNAVAGRLVLEECQACPDDVFRCEGGSKLTTLAGFNRLSPDTDEFIKCPMQGKTQPCLEGDKCIEGHQGALCAQCQPSYFMNSEGRCIKCGSGSSFGRNFVLIILYWLIFIVIVITFVNVLSANQASNRLSTGTYLLKSIVNYIVYLAILTEVFAKYWIHQEPEKQTGAAKAVNELVAFTRSVYSFPLALTIEMAQCQMFAEDIGNGVEVRKAGAYYAGAILIGLVCLFALLRLFRKVEQQKKDGEELESEDAENDEKQMAVLMHALEPDSRASVNSRRNLRSDDGSARAASQGGPGRQVAASVGSARGELAKVNPTEEDKRTEDQYKGEILSTLGRIGGQEQGIPDLVAQALKNKDGKLQTKSEKALAKSYEHLNALKARKLMLQRELTQYQEEVRLENEQQNSALGSDDRGLLNDMDLADPKKDDLAAVNQDDVQLQNLSQDQKDRKPFELEGGEDELAPSQRVAGRQSEHGDVVLSFDADIADGCCEGSCRSVWPAEVAEGGGVSEDTEGQDRSAQSLRGNARSALQHNNFMLQEKIDFNVAGENGRSKSPRVKPEHEAAPPELPNNIRTIEVTTEHTMLAKNEGQRPLNLEPRLDQMVAGDHSERGSRSPSASKRAGQASLRGSAAKLSHRDGTVESLHGRSRLSENVDFRELSKNLQHQLFNFHKFEKLTLFMMIVHFLLNVQVMELIVAAQSCRKVERATFKGQQYDTGAFPIGKWLNTYDSSYECGESVATPALFFSVVYCAFWILAAPAYSLWRAWRLYLIESFGMIAKVLLLAVAKVLSKVNETQSVFLALLVVSIQLIIFVVLCQHQTLSQTEKLTKLNALNNVDLLMYVTLEVTCIIGMIDYLVDPEPESIGEQVLMLLLVLINCLYLFTWAAVSVWMLVRYTYHSPKLALLVLICSCGCIDKAQEEAEAAGAGDDGHSTDRRRKSMQDLENQIKDQIKENLLVEQEKEREMQRIDVLLKHLINKQKQIQASLAEAGVHAPGLTARSQSDLSSMRGGMGASSYRGRYAGEQNKIILELQELLQEQNGKQDPTPGGGLGSQLQQSDIERVNQLDSMSNASASARGDPRIRSRSRDPAASRNARDQTRSADEGPRQDLNAFLNDVIQERKPVSPGGLPPALDLGLGVIGEEDHQQMLEAGNDTFAKSKAATPTLHIEENASSSAMSRPFLPSQPVQDPSSPAAASLVGQSENQGRSKKSLKTQADPKSSRSRLESAVSGIISSLNTIDYQKQDSRSKMGRPDGMTSSQSRPGALTGALDAADGTGRIPGTALGTPERVAVSPLSALSAPDPRRIAENQGQNEDFPEERGGRAASRTRDSKTASDSNLKSASSRDVARPAPQLAAVMSQLSDLQTKLHGKGKDSDAPRDASPVRDSSPKPDDSDAAGLDTREKLKQQLERVAEMRSALQGRASQRDQPEKAAEEMDQPNDSNDQAALDNDYGVGQDPSGMTNILVPNADSGVANRALGARGASQLTSSNMREQALPNQRYRSRDNMAQSRLLNPQGNSRASSEAHSLGADDPAANPQASKKEKQMQLMQAYTSLSQPEISAIKKKDAKDRSRDTAQLYSAESQLVDPSLEKKDKPSKSQSRQRRVTKELKQKMQVIKELTARKKLLKEQENRLAFQ